MTPGAAGTASYRTRGETVAQDETDAAARLAAALFDIDTDRNNPGGLAGRSYEDVAAALLPVVRVLQAEELEAAAAWSTSVPSHMLRARAATLRGEAGR